MTNAPLLAIETSGRTASVALVDAAGDRASPPLERQADPAARTAQALVPAIHGLLQSAGVNPTQLVAVAVASGPGSFTGLRIGVTAAKTLAYATGAKLVGVNTLDLLAHQAAGSDRDIWAVVDAQRGDLFAARYRPADLHELGANDPTQLLSADQWLAQLVPGELGVGPVIARYRERLPAGVQVADDSAHLPRAATVGFVAREMLTRGLDCEAFALVPRYHRLSAAEEKARAARPTA